MKNILIVEDDLTFSTMLATWLGKQGFNVETTGNIAKAIRALLDGKCFDLILSDLRLPDHDGLYLLQWLRKRQQPTPFIVMTGYAEVQNAVEAMKNGASDYIAKPVQPDMLLQKIKDALEHAPSPVREAETQGQRPASQERNGAQGTPTTGFLEGSSPAAQQLYRYVALVAPTPMSVLILGASGTGKEYVARRIHEGSRRHNGPFVAIDCGALHKELAASEFFGHVKGSFTGAVADKTGAFAEADGGTLFLDEVGNLGYDVQVQLLRALQERRIRPVGGTTEREVDIRLVCATNEDLAGAVTRGEFREDLFHRINEFTLHMPELKDRGADLLLFADLFLRQANLELERTVKGFDATAAEAMARYDWPGNLRELKNVVRRAVLLATDDYIRATDVAHAMNEATRPATLPLHDDATERARIRAALQATAGNKSKAAILLGIDRKTLYNKLRAQGTEDGPE